MPSWFRRGAEAGTGAVPVLTTAATSNAVEQLAAGLALAGKLRPHPDVAALLADRDFLRAKLVLLAGAEEEAPDVARRVAEARQGAPCEIAALAEDPLIQIRLRDLDAALPTGVRIRPVSRTAMLARQVFSDLAPPDRVLRLAPGGTLPLLIAGGGVLAAQLMLAALRLLQLPGLVPAIALAGPGMPELLARLRAGLPELDRCGVLTASEGLPERLAPALILVGDTVTPEATLQDIDPDGIAPIVRPALPSWRATGQALRDDSLDRIAREIHQLHLEERIAAGGRVGDQPSQAPWDALPERFREASRHQAGHIPLKLRWAGGRVGAGTPFGWTAAELAALTEAEHARWATVSRLEGWSYAAVRQDGAKLTPLLVPFATLSQEVRDLDALPVRAAPRHLGQPVRRDVIVAIEAEAATPPPDFHRDFRATLEGLRGDNPVLRLGRDTPLMRAVAAVAGACRVPIQVAMPTPPSRELACLAERIAIGPDAMAMLPTPTRTLRIGL